MKYLVLLCDGMADTPVEKLGGKTPMQMANKPNMDKLAKSSTVGICRTVGTGLKPGSDVANLSVMGYDARTCYSGRSPLEAANLGIELADSEISMRCNLVTLSDADCYENRTMVDYCGGDISTPEADELIKALEEHFGTEKLRFYTGVQYRHCLVADGAKLGLDFTPPHDISGKVIGDYLSKVPEAQPFIQIMRESVKVLENHPVNIKRVAEGKRPANSAWFWGEGKRPNLELFYDKFGLNGAVVSAVDLIRGIGRLAGMKVAQVKNVTGYIDTDFDAKATAAAQLFDQADLVYVHIEAPDECGHRGEVDNKVKSIELIDEKVLAPLLKKLNTFDRYKVLIMPDHPTPLDIRTHTSDPVPFLIYDSGKKADGVEIFCEDTARATGISITESTELMPAFLKYE